MKIIFKIARTELRNLFYSPVAWFLAIVFLIQCAYFYMAALYPFAVLQDSAILNMPSFKDWGPMSFTANIFFGEDGILNHVSQNLYLFVPLLTMGLMSREINNGTIKLLYSSPIKLRQIILGKYLAVMVYNLLLIALLSFFMFSAAFQIKSIDYGLLLSAVLGFYLLVCAYTAVGLFMSSLTTYQIVSAIGTFMVVFILSRIGTLWQQYDFVRDLTWFLSIAGRTEQMLMGLITTRDVIYFLIVIVMFLSFTLFKLKGEKESKPWAIKAMRYIGVIIAAVLLCYITSRPGWVGYLDATAEKTNTIDRQTQQILKEMGKEPLEITLYANLLGGGLAQALPESRNPYLSALWDKYQRFKPDITFKYVYYYDNDGRLDNSDLYKMYPGKTEKQIAGIAAGQMEIDSSMFMEPSEIRKQIDPYAENGRLFMAAKYKGQTVHLRTYDDGVFWPKEQEVASKFKRLVEHTWPKVYFVTGNLERNIYKTGEREYSLHSIEKSNRDALINYAYDCDTLCLENQDIPPDITALVIADPKTELGTITRNKLQQYIDKGGNLMILGEPGKQAMLNPVVQQLGVQLMKGQLVQINKNETPDKITSYITDAAFNIFPDGQKALHIKKENRRPDTASNYQTLMVGATAISYTKNGSFNVTPALNTFKKEGWLKMGHLVTDSVPPVFSPEEGDLKQPHFPTAVSLTRQVNKREQRILVLGDADGYSNLRLFANVFKNSPYNWFNFGQYPVYISLPIYKDNRLTIIAPTAKMLKIVYVWVLPGLLLAAGIILLIRRKRK